VSFFSERPRNEDKIKGGEQGPKGGREKESVGGVKPSLILGGVWKSEYFEKKEKGDPMCTGKKGKKQGYTVEMERQRSLKNSRRGGKKSLV